MTMMMPTQETGTETRRENDDVRNMRTTTNTNVIARMTTEINDTRTRETDEGIIEMTTTMKRRDVDARTRTNDATIGGRIGKNSERM